MWVHKHLVSQVWWIVRHALGIQKTIISGGRAHTHALDSTSLLQSRSKLNTHIEYSWNPKVSQKLWLALHEGTPFGAPFPVNLSAIRIKCIASCKSTTCRDGFGWPSPMTLYVIGCWRLQANAGQRLVNPTQYESEPRNNHLYFGREREREGQWHCCEKEFRIWERIYQITMCQQKYCLFRSDPASSRTRPIPKLLPQILWTI